MGLLDQLQNAQLEARKAADKPTLSTLQVLLSEVKNEQIKKQKELTDDEVLSVIARQVKQLKDSKTDFEKAGRADLVTQVDAEISLLETYLPAQISDEEISEVVAAVVAEVGAQGPADMGKVMGPVMKKVQGTADGARVRTIVQQVLAQM